MNLQSYLKISGIKIMRSVRSNLKLSNLTINITILNRFNIIIRFRIHIFNHRAVVNHRLMVNNRWLRSFSKIRMSIQIDNHRFTMVNNLQCPLQNLTADNQCILLNWIITPFIKAKNLINKNKFPVAKSMKWLILFWIQQSNQQIKRSNFM